MISKRFPPGSKVFYIDPDSKTKVTGKVVSLQEAETIEQCARDLDYPINDYTVVWVRWNLDWPEKSEAKRRPYLGDCWDIYHAPEFLIQLDT